MKAAVDPGGAGGVRARRDAGQGRATRRRGGSGATLIVFPEAFVSGYPRGLRVRRRGRHRARPRAAPGSAATGSAIDVPGPATDAARGDRPRARRAIWSSASSSATAARSTARPCSSPPTAPARQAPQADADGRRAARLGLRRRLDAARDRHADRPARRGDLLGELHAAAADGACTRKGDPALLRPDGRRPRDLAGDDAAHRPARAAASSSRRNQFARRSRLPGRLPGRPATTRTTVMSAAAARSSSTRWARSWPARSTTGEAILRAELDLGRDHRGQVRLRRRRPLRAAGRLPARGRRAAAGLGDGAVDPEPQKSYRPVRRSRSWTLQPAPRRRHSCPNPHRHGYLAVTVCRWRRGGRRRSSMTICLAPSGPISRSASGDRSRPRPRSRSCATILRFLADPGRHPAIFADHGVVHVRDVAIGLDPTARHDQRRAPPPPTA